MVRPNRIVSIAMLAVTAVERAPGLGGDEARVSGLPDGERPHGWARCHRGNPTNLHPVPASGNSTGAIECLRQQMTIDAGDVPGVADIETRLKATKNAVFAKHAFGVQR